MFSVLNFGSLNIDHVYQVEHFVRPGETRTAAYSRNAGGKGLNQSVALARAGVSVAHAGKIGPEGEFLLEILRQAGVDTAGILTGDVPTGHACIQVDQSGQNSILLFPGANHALTETEIRAVLDRLPARWLLLQNEINHIPFLMREAKRRKMRIAINPAPCGPEVAQYPLELADLLFVNEIEAAQAAGKSGSPEHLAGLLTAKFPEQELLMTLGKAGALYARGKDRCFVPALPVQAVDTTCAGDTFNGYFLAARLGKMSIRQAMELAARAAAVTVTRAGAAVSIPFRSEL